MRNQRFRLRRQQFCSGADAGGFPAASWSPRTKKPAMVPWSDHSRFRHVGLSQRKRHYFFFSFPVFFSFFSFFFFFLMPAFFRRESAPVSEIDSFSKIGQFLQCFPSLRNLPQHRFFSFFFFFPTPSSGQGTCSLYFVGSPPAVSFSIPSSSTSKISMEPGSMTGGAPRSP